MAAVGTLTITENRVGVVKQVKFAWTATTGGAVSGTSTTYSYNGLIEGAQFVPGTGDDKPSEDYDVTLLDENSLDVLHGLGADLGSAATVYMDRSDGLGAVANSALQLVVSGAGSENKGTVYVEIR